MHSAPSVIYPVGRSRLADRVLMVVWAVGACCAGAASYQIDSIGWRQAVLAASVVFSAWAVFRVSRQDARALMSFDGQHWSLSGESAVKVASVAVVLDFQSLLLVRLQEAGRRGRWLWLGRTACPERWKDLRRAVYSRAPLAGTPPTVP